MKFTNIRTIMDRLTRHPLLEDIPFETVIDYAAEFMKIVGIYPSMSEKTAPIQIHDYRGQLPCDYFSMIQVRTFDPNHIKHPETFRYSTDSFHMSPIHAFKGDLTYKIKGECIFTSIKNGLIEIAYRALPVDEEGYPLIPDDGHYSKALELYIKLQWFNIQLEMGKIQPQIIQHVEQQYAWAVGQAEASLTRPSIDQMESISNMWNKLLPDTTQDHRHGYINEGRKEKLIRH